MEQSSYIIYITKSKEASKVLHDGLEARREKCEYDKVESGRVGHDSRIPSLFYDMDMYYALAEFKDYYAGATYQLIIC